MNQPSVRLNDGAEMPSLGFGVYKIPDDQVRAAVHTAIECGYRSIDTATLYANERGVGAAVASSGVDRRELFVTTKLWNTDHGYDAALRAFDTSLRLLRMDYVDLYLIHWPVPAEDRYVDTWRALERLRAEDRARSIGVSNFQVPHLRRLLDETELVPAVNQIELHPWLQQDELRDFHARHGIVTEGWSPLARGGNLLRDKTIARLAARHGKTPAQIVLSWHLALGNVVIPKSVTPARIRENFDVFDIDLDADDIAAIAAMDDGRRVGTRS